MSQRPTSKIQTVPTAEAGTTPTAVQRQGTRETVVLDPSKSLTQKVFILALWPMLEQLMAFLVGFVDTALAGHLKGGEATDALNAVGPAAYAAWLMGMLQGAIGIGATALIARSVGAAHRRQANAAVGQAMLLACVWGTLFGITIFFVAPFFAYISGLTGPTADMCTEYLKVQALAAPLMAILFIGGACLRGAGDFKSPFGVMVVVNIVNMGASILFVAGPEPVGGHGLVGISMGTVVSWLVGAALMLRLLLGGRGGLRLFPHRLRFHRAIMARIIRVGLPSLFENVLFWAGNFMVLIVVGKLAIEGGGEPVGSHIVAIRIEAISFLPGFALSLAASTMVGQFLGANDPGMARKAAWACWACGSSIMVGLGILFILVPEWFVWIVTKEPVFHEQVPDLLRAAGYAQIGFATSMILSGALRGAGDTRATMLLNFISTYLVRLPLAWYVGVVQGGGLLGVWIVLACELMFRGALFLGRFLQGGWTKIDV